MTEYGLFVSCIPPDCGDGHQVPQAAWGDYEDWKRETMKHCPETVKEFMGKVMMVIDSLVLEKEVHNDESSN